MSDVLTEGEVDLIAATAIEARPLGEVIACVEEIVAAHVKAVQHERDSVLRLYCQTSDVLSDLAGVLCDWSAINRETFVETFTEAGKEHLIPESCQEWPEVTG